MRCGCNLRTSIFFQAELRDEAAWILKSAFHNDSVSKQAVDMPPLTSTSHEDGQAPLSVDQQIDLIAKVPYSYRNP